MLLSQIVARNGQIIIRTPVANMFYLPGRNKFASTCAVLWIVCYHLGKARLSTETKLGLSVALLEVLLRSTIEELEVLLTSWACLWLFLLETHGQTLLVQVMEGVNENAVLAMQMLLAQDVVYALWQPQLLCTSRVGNCIFKGPLKQFLSFLIEYHLYIQSLSRGMLSLKNYYTILTELQVVRHYPSLKPQHSPSTRILCGHRYVLPLWAQCWVVMRVLPNSSWFELSVFDKHVWWWLPESEVYLQGSCLPWCAVAAVYFPHIPQMQKDECCYTNVLECSIHTIHVSCQKQTSLHLCSFEITPPCHPRWL